MKTYIAIGHWAGASTNDIRSIAFAANRKSSFRSSCVDNGFTPYIILTESTMQKIRDCNSVMGVFDIVKGLTSNYRVWNLCCEYIEEGMGIIEKRLADAKAEEEARMAEEAAAEAAETETTEDTNTINTTEEENTMTTIINDNTNANLTKNTFNRYEVRWGKYVDIENPTTEIVAEYKVFSKIFDSNDEATEFLYSLYDDNDIMERNVITLWLVSDENGEAEVDEDEWREIREAQREDRSNRKTAEETGKPYMVSYTEWDDTPTYRFFATAEERDAKALEMAASENVYEVRIRDYVTTTEEAPAASSEDLAAHPDVVAVTTDALNQPAEHKLWYVMNYTTTDCPDRPFRMESTSRKHAKEEIESLKQRPDVIDAWLTEKYTKTNEWGEEVEITEREYWDACWEASHSPEDTKIDNCETAMAALTPEEYRLWYRENYGHDGDPCYDPAGPLDPQWWLVTGRIDDNWTVTGNYFAADEDEAIQCFQEEHGGKDWPIEKVEPEPIRRLGFNSWMLDHLLQACRITGRDYLVEELERQDDRPWLDLPAHMARGLRWAVQEACRDSKNTPEWVEVARQFRAEHERSIKRSA